MATDYFLKIIDPEIKGDSTQAGHENEIEMLDWSWGETQSGNAAMGGANAKGRVSMQDFRFTKRMDTASPKLMQLCANGQYVKRGVFTARRTGEEGGAPVDYLKLYFENMIISSFTLTGHGEDPAESISFNFQRVTFAYRQMQDGKAIGNISSGYDVKESRVINREFANA